MAVAVHECETTPAQLVATQLCPVMVIDAQPLVRAGLVSLIEAHLGRETVCFSGGTVREAMSVSQRWNGACAVLGTRRDEPAGTEVESIAAFAMHGIDVLVLVDDPSRESFEAATVAGAKGYLDKAASPEEFIRAVQLLASGQPCSPSSRSIHARQASTAVRLSEQERRALVLYASGLTQDTVARRMGIAPNTVKHYLDRVRDKYTGAGMQARTKLELHALARAEGLLP